MRFLFAKAARPCQSHSPEAAVRAATNEAEGLLEALFTPSSLVPLRPVVASLDGTDLRRGIELGAQVHWASPLSSKYDSGLP